MPMTRISTNLRGAEHRRRLAQASTEVFRELGLRDEHITTVFSDLDRNDVFVADRSFGERFADSNFVLATVYLGSHRRVGVRANLARALVDAVDGHVAPSDVCAEFVVRDGADVYVGGVSLGSATANQDSPTTVGEGGRDLDQRLRFLLDKTWNVGYRGWEPITPLAALRGDFVEWTRSPR